MGVVLAALASGELPSFGQIFWICLAMVGARSGAMGLNRLIDAKIDADNPRTADRHIPAGKVSQFEAICFVVVSLAVMLLSAWMLNPLCFYLAPVAIGFFVLYALCKRFTHYAHVVLGIVRLFPNCSHHHKKELPPSCRRFLHGLTKWLGAEAELYQ